MSDVVQEKLSPFDIVNNINKKGDYLEVTDSTYCRYVINKVFSNSRDSVLLANEMNAAWELPAQMQYAFLYYGLPKRQRYGKWFKNQDDTEALEAIEEYFGYSRNKAKQVLKMLTPRLDDMRRELDKGGRTCHATNSRRSK